MVNDITLLKQGTKTGILGFVIKVKRFKNSIKFKKKWKFLIIIKGFYSYKIYAQKISKKNCINNC